jgi:hypothetical protein
MLVVSKEGSMLELLSRLLPAHVVHELGGGRAVENARQDRDEVERTTAIIDDLVGRLDGADEESATTPSAA